MYAIGNQDVEGMALAGVHHNILGIPKTSILPEIIKMSATNQEILTSIDTRQKHNLINSYNKILKNKKYNDIFNGQKVDLASVSLQTDGARLSGIPATLNPVASRNGLKTMKTGWQVVKQSKKAI